jgi:hypothetical protein
LSCDVDARVADRSSFGDVSGESARFSSDALVVSISSHPEEAQ